jgi:hypothetical protein
LFCHPFTSTRSLNYVIPLFLVGLPSIAIVILRLKASVPHNIQPLHHWVWYTQSHTLT